MSKVPPKSLKDQNRWPLWLTIAVNFALFFAVAQAQAFSLAGLSGFLSGSSNLLPVGLALIATSIANGLMDAGMKARLVFLRWSNALPGHRAFSEHAASDPRIDLTRLRQLLGEELPDTPADENRVWYRVYKQVEHDGAVNQIHREYLFTRDYAAFSFLFLLGFGTGSFFLSPWQVAALYCLALGAQFVVVRHVAANYGVRLVTTVLAVKAAEQPSSSLRKKMARGGTAEARN